MRKFGIIFYLSILFSQHSIEKDLAYQMVLSHLEDKNLPEAYIKEAFTHDKIKIHPEIADRFARPYEKKTWEEYRKIFVKESRIVAGVKFFTNNKNLIESVSRKYKVDFLFLILFTHKYMKCQDVQSGQAKSLLNF